MPRQEHVLTVFLASPGDLAIEREVAEKVIRALNIEWSRDINVRLDLVRWETHAFPATGGDPQSIINEQIGDDYDIFVGIMWQRFGTPTDRSGSGTQEEFERARQRHEADEQSVSIMMYFKDAPITPSSMDLDEMVKIRDFKKSLNAQLYWTFNSPEDFETKLRLHLVRQIQEWKRKGFGSPPTPVASAPAKASSFELDPTDAGLLDLIEVYEESFDELTEIIARITGAMNHLTSKNTEYTARLGELSKQELKKNERSEARNILKESAAEMRGLSDVVEIEIVNYSRNFDRGVRAVIDSIPLQSLMNKDAAEGQKAGALEAMQTIDRGIESASVGLLGFRNAVDALPRLTTDLNRSKRNLVSSLDRLLGEWSNNRTLIEEAVRTITEN